MDYFLKTKIANWTFPSMLSHYKQHYGGDYNKSLRHLKEDLNNMVGSEAFTEKAKAPLSMFLNKFDKHVKKNHQSKKTVNEQQQQQASSSQSVTNNFNQRSRNIKNVIENHNYKSVKSAKRKYRKTDVESEEDELGEDEVDEEDEEDEKDEEEEDDEGERRNAGRKMDFLVGGEVQVYIEDYHDNWVMNGLNISKKFHEFRNHCIDMIGRTGQEPNFVQELALNGIMWFDDKQRLYFSMKSDEWKEAKSSLKSLYHNSTPTVKYPEIDGIVETLAEDIDEGEKKAEKWYASTTMNENEESKKIVARTLLCLIQKMKTCCLEELKEPLFCSFVVENLVTPFLCLGDDYVKLLGSTDESLGSKERRSGMKGRIPDLSVQVEFNNYSALPFLCEVKSPQSIVDLKKSENQHPDFIKLCNIMKDELDRMCFVTNKVVYGLLVEGFKCRLFAMDLKYYKLYRLHMLSQFYLPRDKYDLGIISSCFSRLERLNHLMQKSTTSILDDFLHFSSEEGMTSPGRRPNNVLVSFRSPQK